MRPRHASGRRARFPPCGARKHPPGPGPSLPESPLAGAQGRARLGLLRRSASSARLGPTAPTTRRAGVDLLDVAGGAADVDHLGPSLPQTAASRRVVPIEMISRPGRSLGTIRSEERRGAHVDIVSAANRALPIWVLSTGCGCAARRPTAAAARPARAAPAPQRPLGFEDHLAARSRALLVRTVGIGRRPIGCPRSSPACPPAAHFPTAGRSSSPPGMASRTRAGWWPC